MLHALAATAPKTNRRTSPNGRRSKEHPMNAAPVASLPDVLRTSASRSAFLWQGARSRHCGRGIIGFTQAPRYAIAIIALGA